MSNAIVNSNYHSQQLSVLVSAVPQWTMVSQYRFENFFHPFVGTLMARLNRGSLADIYEPVWQNGLTRPFFDQYSPQNTSEVTIESESAEIDFDDGPYSNYNWELFFHIPLTIAVHLSKTRRFAEAQRWFHRYLFDPTSNDRSVKPPARFWRFLPFRAAKPMRIETLLALLSKSESELSSNDVELRRRVLNSYHAILDHPFQPHAVARTRHLAYQYSVVMKYLDNLIAWGDNLFAQDTVESINEATQRYVLAANILGPRPQRIPQIGTVKAKTFAELKKAGLDEMSNALVEMEGQFPFNFAPPATGGKSGEHTAALFGIGQTLYFCIPRNEKLLSYWDIVADRLFKIRHSLNLQGIARPLALFDPPIDPGMLVKAAAAGLDVGSIVNGLNQPIGPVRSHLLIQKALELCAEVRGLGNALLSALEKSDAEEIALLRQRHEVQIHTLAREVRFLQWKAAENATEALLASRATAMRRLNFYKRLLGQPPDPNAPEALPLDRRELTEENFDEAFARLVGQYDVPVAMMDLPQLRLAGNLIPSAAAGVVGLGEMYMNLKEAVELNVLLPAAMVSRGAATAADLMSGVLQSLPDLTINLQYWGLGASSVVAGGSKAGGAAKTAAEVLRGAASATQDVAGMTSRAASYERRADEWILQHNLAAHEVKQLGRQILTSLINEQVTRREFLNVQRQIANAQELDELLHSKFTNRDLYLWMRDEVSRLYYEYYLLAYDTARRAERAMKQELMRPELDQQQFIKFNYRDEGRKGLLAGEALHLDVKRMELAYHDNNKRELELTRHVSLRQLDPLALLNLRALGTCTFTVPEWLYDRDCPGHYMRRIKSVAVSVPSVVGPYTGIHATLSLLSSTVRKSPERRNNHYERQSEDDSRFIDYPGTPQPIVTSSGTSDGGLFETNLRDERYLPFEGAGAESTWQLTLPSQHRAFDYNTISDVILHIRYTARAGVDESLVAEALKGVLNSSASGLGLLFTLRSDFAAEWSAFANGADLKLTIRKDFFPYLVHGHDLQIDHIAYYFVDTTSSEPTLKHVDLEQEAVATFQKALKNGSGEITWPAATAPARDAKGVFLLLQYSTSN